MRHRRVDFCVISKEIRLDYTPEAQVGDYVLVHVGFAAAVVDGQEAQGTFEALRQLDHLKS